MLDNVDRPLRLTTLTLCGDDLSSTTSMDAFLGASGHLVRLCHLTIVCRGNWNCVWYPLVKGLQRGCLPRLSRVRLHYPAGTGPSSVDERALILRVKEVRPWFKVVFQDTYYHQTEIYT